MRKLILILISTVSAGLFTTEGYASSPQVTLCVRASNTGHFVPFGMFGTLTVNWQNRLNGFYRATVNTTLSTGNSYVCPSDGGGTIIISATSYYVYFNFPGINVQDDGSCAQAGAQPIDSHQFKGYVTNPQQNNQALTFNVTLKGSDSQNYTISCSTQWQ